MAAALPVRNHYRTQGAYNTRAWLQLCSVSPSLQPATSCVTCRAQPPPPAPSSPTAGTYSDIPGLPVCYPCQAGQYAFNPGQTTCRACPPGNITTWITDGTPYQLWPLAQLSGWPPCPAGTYSLGECWWALCGGLVATCDSLRYDLITTAWG